MSGTVENELDLGPMFSTPQVTTDEFGVHTDGDGNGYLQVVRDGETSFVPRADPHGRAEGPDTPISLFRSEECGAGKHASCNRMARWEFTDSEVVCECLCHDDEQDPVEPLDVTVLQANCRAFWLGGDFAGLAGWLSGRVDGRESDAELAAVVRGFVSAYRSRNGLEQ